MEQTKALIAQNNFSTLKPEEQLAYRTFLTSAMMPNKFVFISEPQMDEFESEKDKKRKKVAKYSILGAVMLTVAGALISPRFIPQSIKQKVTKFVSAKFNKIINEAVDPRIKAKYEHMLASVKKKADKLNVMNNLTTAKDAYAKKLYEYIPPLRWLDKKSSALYRSTGIKMTQKDFKKAAELFDAVDGKAKGIMGAFAPSRLKQTVTIDGQTKTIGEFRDDVLRLMQKRNEVLEKSFGKTAQGTIVSEIDDIFKDIAPRYRKEFEKALKEKNYNKLFTFMAEDMSEGDKAKLVGKLNERLCVITNTGEQKGLNEQINKILGSIISSRENSQEIEPIARRANKMLRRAVDKQGNIYFDKMRDVYAGSAPTDVTSALISAGGLGLYMSQAKTKEERNSVALTTGIPLILGITGSTFATMKMVSGFNALAIGAATTILSGIVGKSLDKAYKEKHGIDPGKQPSIPTIKVPLTLENSLSGYTDSFANIIIKTEK